MKKPICIACQAVLLSALLSALFGAGVPAIAQATPAAPEATKQATPEQAIFARVGDAVITHAEYDNALVSAARSKFYHGRAPEKDVAALQRSVADDLVTRVLLLREARRRGLTADKAEIGKTLDGYEQRYGNSEHWKKNKESILPGLTARLEEDNLVAQLEKLARTVPDPDVDAVKAYYEANADKFTEPERVRVSVILIPVDPTSPLEAWDKAAEEISGIQKRIREGADFADMARAHSKVPSAGQGGDMGYLHKGMLPVPVQDLLTTLKPGDLSEPLRLLEGVGLLRLVDRIEPKKHDFARVEQRARDLLKRDQSNAAWTSLIAELKKATPAQIDESKFLPLAESAGDGAAPN
ncbi:MAG TPA: peptidylprolyl isomerase [Noviherbaspirillum sp.]|nr:peptidylprolyl isomerase [Noviherbaspirillum sp.]